LTVDPEDDPDEELLEEDELLEELAALVVEPRLSCKELRTWLVLLSARVLVADSNWV
jgi:hypothetical protein